MNSRTTRRFRRAFAELPDEVKGSARDAYRLFRDNPSHPSLRFKQVHPTDPIHSVRVGLGYRALAPVALARNLGFNAVELRRVQRLVAEHEPQWLEAWNEYFRR